MAEFPLNLNDGFVDVTASGNGQKNFAFDFPLLAAGDLRVSVVPVGTGEESAPLTLTTHYTVAGIEQQNGGTVTLVTGRVIGDRVLIRRRTAPVRTVDYQEGGDFRAETVNRDFDRAIMALQDARRDIDENAAGLAEAILDQIAADAAVIAAVAADKAAAAASAATAAASAAQAAADAAGVEGTYQLALEAVDLANQAIDASEAAQVASAASASAANTSANAAAASATAASGSATTASGHATTANTHKNAAAASATAAATSATNAGNSATAAAGSASTAASHVSTALGHSNAALSHSNTAGSHATAAAGSATSAQTARTAAETAAGAAEDARDEAFEVVGAATRYYTDRADFLADAGNLTAPPGEVVLGIDHYAKLPGAPTSLGTELLTNGAMAADANWTKGAGWTIASGKATNVNAGTSASLSQAVTLPAVGEWVALVWTVLDRVSGGLAARLTGGTASIGSTRSANGTYTEYLEVNTGNTTLAVFPTSPASISMDNLSLKHLVGAFRVTIGSADYWYQLMPASVSAADFLAIPYLDSTVGDRLGIIRSGRNGFGMTGDGVADELALFDEAADFFAGRGGGKLLLEDGDFRVTGPVVIDEHNFKLDGQGQGGHQGTAALVRTAAASRMLYDGVANGALLRFTCKAGEYGKQGGGIRNVMLDGNNLAGRLLDIRSRRGLVVKNVLGLQATQDAFYFTQFEGALAGVPYDTQGNQFEHVVYLTTGNTASVARALRLTGSAGNGQTAPGNSCFNYFYRCSFDSGDQDCAQLEDCDNNYFFACKLDYVTGSHYGLVLGSGDQDSIRGLYAARHNQFYACEIAAPFCRAGQTGKESSNSNLFVGLARSNGRPLPILEAGAGGSADATASVISTFGSALTPRPVNILGADTQLTPYHSRVVFNTGGVARVLTLPSASAYGSGQTGEIVVYRQGNAGGSLTVAAKAGQTVNGGASVTIANDTAKTFICTGALAWYAY